MPSASAVSLFAYGTLQERRVQVMLFKRDLAGSADTLRGYVLVLPGRGWRYPNIVASTDPAATVPGLVYEISEQELARADSYEGEAYKRIWVALESGISAWVYLCR